jgi:hypothetical protein
VQKVLDSKEKKSHLCSPQTRKRKEGKRGKKRQTKIKKNKVCKFKKGFYLCSPKRKGRKKRKEAGNGRASEAGKRRKQFRKRKQKRGKEFPKQIREKEAISGSIKNES